MREKIFKYVKEKYNIEPDYPFSTAPTYPVLRHVDNRKWFALIMDVQREKLGLKGTDYVDIINLKLGDPMLVDMIVRQPGYFYGYHITRSSWIDISTGITSPAAAGSPSCWTGRFRSRRSVSGSTRAMR